jgi:transcription initiation factor TFIID TATA-box-binding protein
MLNIKIENIIAFAELADGFDINKLAEENPEFIFNLDDFRGLTLKLDDPKTAVLILPVGKVICTGAKTIEDAENSLKILINKLKKGEIKLKPKPKLIVQNIIVSYDFKKELNLSSISTGLILKNVSYETDNFPGLIYKINEIGAILILFSSGKIVCTGTNNIEDASKEIEIMKEKLSSIGAL